MYDISIDNVPVGASLYEDVYKRNGDLVYKSGTIVSRSVIKRLIHENYTSVKINAILTDGLDLSMTIDNLSGMSLKILRIIQPEHILKCTQVIVNRFLLNSKYEVLKDLAKFDFDTYQHCLNVAYYSLAVGIACGFGKEKLKNLMLGALLHDIGKQNIGGGIISKPGKLSNDERVVINMHPKLGAELVNQKYGMDVSVSSIILQHHEDYDGTGYPYNIQGESIIDTSMIVHICDVYDALNSKRSYKDSFNKEKVLSIMDSYCGTKFNEDLYRVFRKTIPTYYIGEEIHFSEECIGVVIEIGHEQLNPKINVRGEIFFLQDYIENMR